ncbi:hypothetical protein [Qipengyuania marisflavi]|uniref:Porin n=1 Tax=Qipengyuania marisflavi TaxID=2486356 RepID=A0A5S3PXK9_9SPHN|nr:hypothetical protein [Qipengyuania marisflavi]TMM48335.1 hypothetical protein FEV51_08640 [Qipengyuania marisflavi]
MALFGAKLGKMRVFPAVLAGAGLALTVPGTVLAVGGADTALPDAKSAQFYPFTPAKVDAQLALKVAALLGDDSLRFTPASSTSPKRDRTVTVAVRVDPETARAISIRGAIDAASGDDSRLAALVVSPTRYNLGISRGYQNFAKPAKEPALTEGLRNPAMPDLASFRPEKDSNSGKKSRFQSRIALENEENTGRSARTYESAGDQSLDVRGSYRLGRNLDVTAGVRLSQDRDRLAPLTDGVEDSQAVYVGTQIRF